MSTLAEVIEQNERSLVFSAEWLDAESREVKHPDDAFILKMEFLDGTVLSMYAKDMPENGLILRWSNGLGGEL